MRSETDRETKRLISKKAIPSKPSAERVADFEHEGKDKYARNDDNATTRRITRGMDSERMDGDCAIGRDIANKITV